MHRAAKLFSQAQEIMKEVDNYFEEKGIDVEELRSGDGISLEELEYGIDITDRFVEWFEENY